MVVLKIEDRWEIGVALNLLFVLLAIFRGIRHNHRTQEPPIIFPSDLKAGIRPAAVYTIILTGFIFVYYNYIDFEFIEDMRRERIEVAAEEIEIAGGWEEFKEEVSDPQLEDFSKEDYLDQIEDNVSTFISPGSASTISLFGLLAISFVYTLILAILYRKVLVKMER